MPTAARLLPAAGYRRAPWRNGLGISDEVARGESAGATQWLVSLTTIAADCPFSDYRGCDRILTPLAPGVSLTLDGAPPASLAPFIPFAFSGDASVACRLASGPVAVVNATVARSWGSQKVTLLRGAVPQLDIAAPIVVLHALGHVQVALEGASFALAPGDSLRIDGQMGATAAIAAAPEATLYRAAFQPHR